jgi:hypothetical protein
MRLLLLLLLLLLQVGYSSMIRRAAAKFWVDDGWRRRGLKRRLRRAGRIEWSNECDQGYMIEGERKREKNGNLLSCV